MVVQVETSEFVVQVESSVLVVQVALSSSSQQSPMYQVKQRVATKRNATWPWLEPDFR